MSTPCLRCEKPMEIQQVDNIEVRFCCDCKAMLLRHADLIQVLEQSWRFVPQEKVRLMEFRVTDALKREATIVCPDCGQSMEKYGYLGFSAIPIDRCDRCALVWLDSDDLQNMVLALAKNNYGVQTVRKAEKNQLDVASIGLELESLRGEWL